MPQRSRNPMTHHARAVRAALSALDRSLGRLIALTSAAGRGAAVAILTYLSELAQLRPAQMLPVPTRRMTLH